ncbi:OmpA family protein [Azospirillum sp. ST 5-10]|uniref:OmpA family protein n=1 Tax=unclassified Azospirillum TaxID=2630922 RepID=UPI003F4A067B
MAMTTPRPAALAAVALGAALLAGCASDAGNPTAVMQAREAYTAAATDPTVAQRAPLELRKAEQALREAQEAQEEGAGSEEVTNKAYIATRQAQVARETAALKSARETVEGAETTRLQVRNAELERQIRELQAEQTERGLVMTLGDVLFATGRADLTPGAMNRVDRLAAFLQRYPARTVRIEGHTDSTGGSATNLHLSEERAAAVQQALVARGISPSRITAVGYGAAQPVASNSSDAGRQANRRVEIVIPDEGTFAENR